jgi:hypothetical protein
MSWKAVTRSSLCSGVKECRTKRAHNILFLKHSFRIRRTAVFGDVQRFCYNSCCESTIIFTKSATAAMFTSVRVDFGRPPLSPSSTSSLPSRNQEYHLKTFDQFRASFPQAFCTNTSVSVADRTALKQNFMVILCSFPPSMTYKEN